MPIEGKTIVSLARAHLSEVFRWSAEREIEKAEIVAAALGMAAPLLFALIRGDLSPRLTAAMGGLAVGRVEIAAGFKTHLRREAEALAPANRTAAALARVLLPTAVNISPSIGRILKNAANPCTVSVTPDDVVR